MSLTQRTLPALACLAIGVASTGIQAQQPNKKAVVRPAAPAGIVIGKSTCAAAAANLGATVQSADYAPFINGQSPEFPGATIEVQCMEPHLPVQKMTITAPAGGVGFPLAESRFAELVKAYGEVPVKEDNLRRAATFLAPNAEIEFYKSVESTNFILTYRTRELAAKSKAAMKRDYPGLK